MEPELSPYEKDADGLWVGLSEDERKFALEARRIAERRLASNDFSRDPRIGAKQADAPFVLKPGEVPRDYLAEFKAKREAEALGNQPEDVDD